MEQNTRDMLAGKPYTLATAEISRYAQAGHRLSQEYNQTFDTESEKRASLVDQLLGGHGKNTYLQGPIQFDYGRFTTVGDNFYANFNFTVLDTCPVTIGDNVMIGPNVSLLTAKHPLMYQQRNVREVDGEMVDYEFAAPITIGDNCWLGGNVTVLGGVTIGTGSVIGAGTVVTKSVPANSLVVGVPGKVIRQITEADRIANYPW